MITYIIDLVKVYVRRGAKTNKMITDIIQCIVMITEKREK